MFTITKVKNGYAVGCGPIFAQKQYKRESTAQKALAKLERKAAIIQDAANGRLDKYKGTLIEVLSSFLNGFGILVDYDTDKFLDYLEHKVVAEHDGCVKAFPGPHRNVYVWWELESGHAVGFNENPSVGWSFPVVKLR